MIRTHVHRGLVATALVLLVTGATGQPAPNPPGAPISPRPVPPPVPVVPVAPVGQGTALAASRVPKLRTPDVLRKLNQEVTLEGFYYDGTIPMLLDDLDRLNKNVVLPDDAYVPLTGALPAGLKSGEKIRIKARLVKPAATDKRLAREPAVANLLAGTTYQSLAASTLTALQPVRVATRPPLRILPTRYAVLISGGASYASNYPRYWNDTVRTYNLLVSKGFPTDHIKVVYADGVPRNTDLQVDAEAKLANLQSIFTDIGGKMSSSDTLYVMVTDHGGGYNLAEGATYGGVTDTSNDEDTITTSSGTQVKMDETINLWGEKMTDDQFKSLLASVPNYSRMILQFNQCFSGGFLRDVAGPRRIVMSAASKTEFSWASDATSPAQYEEFLEHYLTALEGGAASADKNNDGKVSILEAYEYARAKDSRAETPFYDDDGIFPPHSGPMPGGGEGALGADTFL